VQGALEVPIEGSIGLFVMGMALHLFATTSMGIFLGTVARSMPQMGLLMIITLLPCRCCPADTPAREHARIGAEPHAGRADHPFCITRPGHLYRGAGFSIVWPQFLALIAIGSVFFVLALSRFRKTISSMA